MHNEKSDVARWIGSSAILEVPAPETQMSAMIDAIEGSAW
jgi:hypothetical protein